MKEELNKQVKIVRERIIYHFGNIDGTYNIPNNLPFMKEFLNDIIKLCNFVECENKTTKEL